MRISHRLMAGAAALAFVVAAAATPASADPARVRVGTLDCHEASGWGLIFGSTHEVRCSFTRADGRIEHYTGHIEKFGVDVGYHGSAVLLWGVLAPTDHIGRGALAGGYGGVTAGATAGVGAAANLLVGGSDHTISLQPLSVEGETGLNIAAGVAGIRLHYEP